MTRSQTESIRGFILDCVAADPKSVAREVAQAYGISRQAANRHLDVLVAQGLLEQEGSTRSKEYRLRRQSLLNREIRVTPVLNPDRLWDDHIAPVLASDPADVRDLCRGAFGELIRNVIRHARASWVTVSFSTTPRHIDISVADDGDGIFRRLCERIGVGNDRECAELMRRHANARSADFPAAHLALLGRHFESFSFHSAGLTLAYDMPADAWDVREDTTSSPGTRVALRLRRTHTISSSARRSSKADSTSSTLKPSAAPSSI